MAVETRYHLCVGPRVEPSWGFHIDAETRHPYYFKKYEKPSYHHNPINHTFICNEYILESIFKVPSYMKSYIAKAKENPMKLSEIVAAEERGEAIERKSKMRNSSWRPKVESFWEPAHYYYRVKPVPKFRPWKAEEVPPVGTAFIGLNDTTSTVRCLSEKNKNTVILGQNWEVDFYSLLANYKYSTDQEKTWHPCGVEE